MKQIVQSRPLDLLLLLLAALLIRLPWLFVIPTFDAPDEINHLWVVDFMRTHLCLPSAATIFAAGCLGEYGSLPQFGYLPQVLTSILFSSVYAGSMHAAVLGARCGSLLGALATIAAAYFIGREVFAKHRLLAFALPALLVLQPQFVFVSCYCNNDSTAAAIGGWIFYLLIRCIKYGLSFRRALLLSVLLSWLTLCKYSGLSILPIVLVSLVISVYRHKPEPSKIFSFLAALVIPYVALVCWWPIRNYYEFHGDVLGTHTMYLIWARTFHKQLNYYMSPWQILATPAWWRMLFYSFWGAYGHMNKYMWRPVYFAYIGFTVAGIAGWIKSARTPRTNTSEASIWFLFAAALLINMVALVWAGTSNLGGPQGRYFFTSLIPIDALLLAGLGLLGTRAGKICVVSFLLFNAAVCCGSWVYLYRLYGLQCM
jgi:4-amino-4-deoxy-L-arabinose transferase-like glycosyltransferase